MKTADLTPEELQAGVLDLLNTVLDQWTRQFDVLEKRGNLKQLCVKFFQYGEGLEAIEATYKQLCGLFERLNKQVLPAMMEKEGIDKLQIPEVARSFYPLDKYSAAIGENKDATFKWLRSVGAGDLIIETVHAQTLAAFLKDKLINENVSPPEGTCTLHQYKIIGMSKYTPKNQKGAKK
jgi:hypothetical protein